MNLMPPKLNTPVAVHNKNNPFLQFIMLVVIIGVFGYMVLWPQFLKLNEVIALKNKLDVQISQLDVQYARLKELSAVIMKSQSEITMLDEMLPLDTKLSKIYYQTDKLAVDAGLTVVSVTAQKMGTAQQNTSSNGRNTSTIQIAINLTGTIDQVIDYMKKLSSVNRIYEIEGFEISSQKDQLVTVKMSLLTYYYPSIGQNNE